MTGVNTIIVVLYFRGEDDSITARADTKEESHTFDMPGKELLSPSDSTVVLLLLCPFLPEEEELQLLPLLLRDLDL